MVDRPLTNFRATNGIMLPHIARNMYTCEVRINWLHPLARGLKLCIIPVAGGWVDLVRLGRRYWQGGNTKFDSLGYSSDKTNARWQDATGTQRLATTDLDFAAGWSLGLIADGANQGLFSHQNDSILAGNNKGLSLGNTGTNAAIILCMNNSADAAHWALIAANNTLPTVGPYSEVATGDGTTVRLYVNAASVATSTTMTQLPGALTAGVTTDMDGACSIGCMWDHTLNTDEIMLFHKQPYGFITKGMDADLFPYGADFKTTYQVWAS